MAVTLDPRQSQVYSDIFIRKKQRFSVVNCCRGWGKSYLGSASASTAVHELMDLDPMVPNKNVAIVAPTYSQVTDIYLPLLKHEFGMEDLAIRPVGTSGKFILPGNVELHLLSYESVERMRGKGRLPL